LRRLARRSAALIALSTAATACGSSSPKLAASALIPIGAGLRGQPALRARVYARGVPDAAAMTVDGRGRLWIAAAGLSTHGRDGVYLVARPGARPVRVIGGLDDPLGLVWVRGELFVSSVGRVSAFGGFTGRRFASSRTVLTGPVRGGENNGLALGPDGRLMMGITATCDHCRPKSRYSGAIVSFRPDGRDLRVYAARIRAPVGLTYYPGTSDLFVSMNQRDDLGARTPGDWLAVVAPGTSWGFPECYGQGGRSCAGVPGALAVLDKHAAVGPVVIATGQLGSSVGTAALVSEWQTAKVARVALVKHGSSFKGSVSTWLTGLRNPLAMTLAPGPSLLVGDWSTGIIYRLTGRTG
jgi:hypothetical protein